MATKTISGTYSSGYTLQSSTTTLSITSGGYVGGHGVIAASGTTAQTIINDGTIHAYEKVFGDFALGVTCSNPADVVINGSATDTRAYIEGQIDGVAGAGRLTNFGTIVGGLGASGGACVEGAYVVNGSLADTSALIKSGSAFAIAYGGEGSTTPATVVNFGTIFGYYERGLAVYLDGGGRVTNGAVNDVGASIDGSVALYNSGNVTNFGTIGRMAGGDGGSAVSIKAGVGTVVNGSSADTSARMLGAVLIGQGSIVNYGTIAFDGNSGRPGYSVTVASAAGEVTNLGVIENFYGFRGGVVGLLAGGSLTNGSATDHQALIDDMESHGYAGVVLQGAGTVTNFGTIEAAGGDAVLFKSSADTLIVEAGAVFIGAVIGGGGTLDLANGSGTINNAGSGAIVVSGDMPASTFTGFGAVDIAAGAAFEVKAVLTVAAGHTLDLAGTLAGGGRLAVNGGTLDIGSTALLTVADVDVYTSSVVNVAATRLLYAGDWTQSGATLTVAEGGLMVFSGAEDRISGTLAGAGVVDFAAGADTLDGVTIEGETDITGTAAATLSGLTTLSPGAVLKISAPTLMIAGGGATLAGGGRLTLAGASTLEGVTGSTKLIDKDDLIEGGGALGGGRLMLVNDAAGVIDGSFPIALTIDTGANAVANAGLIEATGAGGVVIESAVHNKGTLFANGGNLTVDGAVVGVGVVRVRAATADVNGAFSEDVTFVTSGTLELADSQTYRGAVSGFSRTGATSLDLGDIAFGDATEANFSGTATSGVLTVTDGTHTARITLVGNYLSSTFVASSDGHGGVSVVDTTAENLPAGPSAPAFVAAMAAFGAPTGGLIAAQPHWTSASASLAISRTSLQ